MNKLIKYDFVKYKFNILIVPVIFYCMIALTVITKIKEMGISLSILTLTIYIVSFVVSIKLLMDYVFGEDSELFFTIPIEGYKILVSRIISSFIAFFGSLFIAYFGFYLVSPILNSDMVSLNKDMSYILNTVNTELTLSSIINSLIIYAIFFLQIILIFYFVISFCSSSIRKVRLGKVFSLVLGLAMEIINIVGITFISKVSEGFKYIDFNKVIVGITQMGVGGYDAQYGDYSYSIYGYNLVNIKLYIPVAIYVVVTIIILFYITSKFIDKKVEIY
ncbi:MAG: hypothetical protein ACERKV_12185 [Clostridiaceae bacterium]